VIPPIQLTDDVELRLLRTGDAEALLAAYKKNREHLLPWDPARPDEFFTDEWHVADVERNLGVYEAGNSLPLVVASGERIVGRVNLTSIVRGPLQSAVLGYWLDADLNGRGIVSAAVAAVIGIARDELGLHRLEAGTLVHNEASQRVLAKAGFEQFGLAPKYLRIAGEWQDHRLFQILLHD
jgi:[ribosomal protein S5]-alanine N-acetyltransferase